MLLHADAVAENRAAGEGAGGINRNDADCVMVVGCPTQRGFRWAGVFRFPTELRELINQCALAGSRSAGETDGQGFSGLWKKFFEEFGPPGGVILDGGNGAGEGTSITRT